MNADKGTLLLLLTGGTRLKQRVQHPKVQECRDYERWYWFFRYWDDEVLPDRTTKPVRKRHVVGPSKGKDALTHKQAEIERDRFLSGLYCAPAAAQPLSPGSEPQAPRPEDIIFGKLAQLWLDDYVEKIAAGRPMVAAPTRAKYNNALTNHIVPRWKDTRLADLRPKDVLAWLQEEATSWHMMSDLRGVMSGIITKAQEWEILPETFGNPIHRVKLPKKWEVREKRILTPEETEMVLRRLDEEGNRLICETCLDTGTRISEVTGLQVKHVDLEKGTIRIAQRNWQGDIDVPKTDKSKRILTLGALTARYKAWIERLERKGPDAWVFPQAEIPAQPRWDSGVRQALKRAARSLKPEGAEKDHPGLDFPGFGPHTLRRANITWRQEVGGSSIETSKIAGHAHTRITEEYTLVGLKRQEELTRRLQDKRAKAAKKAASVKVVEIGNKEAVA
jgi:integrase